MHARINRRRLICRKYIRIEQPKPAKAKGDP